MNHKFVETPEQEGYSITNDLEADKAIERIKKMERSQERFKDLITLKIAELKQQLVNFNETVEAKKDFYKHHIKTYIDSLDKDTIRVTKSGNKIYDLSAGKVTMSKHTQYLYDKSNPKFIEYLQENGMVEYVKQIKEVAWGDFKKELVSEDGLVFVKATGMIIPDELVSAEIKDEMKIV